MKTFVQFVQEDIQGDEGHGSSSDYLKISREEVQQLFGGIMVRKLNAEGELVIFVQVVDQDALINGLAALGYEMISQPVEAATDPENVPQFIFSKGDIAICAYPNYRKGGGTTTDGFNLAILNAAGANWSAPKNFTAFSNAPSSTSGTNETNSSRAAAETNIARRRKRLFMFDGD